MNFDVRWSDFWRLPEGHPPPRQKAHPMRTRLAICRKKKRFASEADAIAAAHIATIDLRPYLCDRCRHHHLTSRTRGKRRLPAAA